MDVKNTPMRESRSIEVSKVMPEESQVGASAARAVVERSVWKMQNTGSLFAHAEWVHSATFGSDNGTVVSCVKMSGQMVGRSQRNAPAVRKTHDRQKQESCFRVLIPFGEMVIPSEKTNENGKTWNRLSVVLGFRDRSDRDAETDCDRTVGREKTSRTKHWAVRASEAAR